MQAVETVNSIYSLIRFCVCSILFSGMMPLLVQAQTNQEDLLSRPDPHGTPTKVEVRVLLMDIDEIDGAQQSFTANVFYAARWQDTRLTAVTGTSRTMGIGEVWNPKIQVVNSQRLWASFPEEVSARSDGVRYLQRYWGQFSNSLNLQDFPLDRHTFEIRLVSIDPPSEVQLTNFDDPKTQSALGDQLSIADWNIENWNASPESYRPVPGAPELSSYVFRFTAKRNLGYYIVQVLIPLTLIVMMSWIVFWIHPSESSTQISIAITAMLTLIAYRFSISNDLPHISYLTRMDIFLMGSTILVFGGLVQAAVTSRIVKADNSELALKVDRWSRVVFPISFGGLLVYAFLV